MPLKFGSSSGTATANRQDRRGSTPTSGKIDRTLRNLPMKKYLCILHLLIPLLFAIHSTYAIDEDAVVGDDDGTGQVTTITLAWNRNPEPDIAGYNVYYGRVSGDYLRIVSVVRPWATIMIRGHATVYFAVTAYNTDGQESDFSEEIHWP